MIPVTIRVQAKRLPGAGRTSVSDDVCSITFSVLHAWLVTFHSCGVILEQVKSDHTWLDAKI
jgi:hypothetical protein